MITNTRIFLLAFILLSCFELLAQTDTISYNIFRTNLGDNLQAAEDNLKKANFKEAIEHCFLALSSHGLQARDIARVNSKVEEIVTDWVEELETQRALAEEGERRFKQKTSLLYGVYVAIEANQDAVRRQYHEAALKALHAIQYLEDSTEVKNVPEVVYQTFGNAALQYFMDTLEYHPLQPIEVEFAGDQLLVLDRDSVSKYWRFAETWESATASRVPHSRYWMDADIDRQSRRLAIGGWNGLSIYAPDQEIMYPLTDEAVTKVAWYDSQTLFYGTRNGAVYRWSDNRITPLLQEADSLPIVDIQVAADSELVFARSMRNGYYWQLDQSPQMLPLENDLILQAHLMDSPVELFIITQKTGPRIWSEDIWKTAPEPLAPLLKYCFGPSRRQVMAAAISGEVVVYDGGKLWTSTAAPLTGAVDQLGISDDSRFKVLTTAGQLLVQDGTDWKVLSTGNSRITSLAFSPRDKYHLLVGMEDGRFNIWDLEQQSLLLNLQFGQAIERVFFDEKGKQIFVLFQSDEGSDAHSLLTMPIPDVAEKRLEADPDFIRYVEEVKEKLRTTYEIDLDEELEN